MSLFDFFQKKDSSRALAKKYREREPLIITEKEKKVFYEIFRQLPLKYSFLSDQIENNIFEHKLVGMYDPTEFDLAVSEENMRKYSNYDLPSYFTLKGIYLNKFDSQSKVELSLGINSGLLIDYSIQGEDVCNIDYQHIDVSKIYEKIAKDDANELIKKILGTAKYNRLTKKFVLNNVYITNRENKDYVVFATNDVGDIHCIDYDGNVYFMTHDPLDVKLLNV